MTALLRSVAAEARPNEGSAKAIAHVVRVLRRCPWLEGELRMDLVAEGPHTALHLYTEQDGVRERALPAVLLDVPLDEIEETVHHAPDLFAPLRMSHQKQRLVFTHSGIAATPHPPAPASGPQAVPYERTTVKRSAFLLGDLTDSSLPGGSRKRT